MILLFLFLQLFLSLGYKLLDIQPIFPKILKPCTKLEPEILEVAREISNDLKYFQISDTLESGIMCSSSNIHYGYTNLYDNRTDIWINNELIKYPNTLYNVVLHEIIHSVGLDHSIEPGIMNYSIRVSGYNNNFIPINDDRKLWLSLDDRQGIIKASRLSNNQSTIIN